MEKDSLSINLIFAILCLAGGRLSEGLEDSKDYVLEEVVFERKNELPFKKKNYRMHRKNIKSACSDLYFLTSDDESFNKNQIYI